MSSRPPTASGIPEPIDADEVSRKVVAALGRRKRDTLSQRAKPFVLPVGIVLGLIIAIAGAVGAHGTKADRSEVRELDIRVRAIERGLDVQTAILRRIERSLGGE